MELTLMGYRESTGRPGFIRIRCEECKRSVRTACRCTLCGAIVCNTCTNTHTNHDELKM